MRCAMLLVFPFSLLVCTAASAQGTVAAKSYLDRGLDLYAKGEFDKAIDDFDVAITFDPAYSAAYYNRGNARRAMQDWDGAASDYGRAIEINPRFFQAYANRGAALLMRGDL